MGGFHLVQHTGQWFELLPDEDALLRDIFLEYRAGQISETGSPGNTIWDALPAMEKASGHGFLELSADMARLFFLFDLTLPRPLPVERTGRLAVILASAGVLEARIHRFSRQCAAPLAR